MKILITALLLLVPVPAMAMPTMGIYFTYEPFNVYHYPDHVGEQFDGYVYVHNTDCYLTAVEFQVAIGHPAIQLTGFDPLPGWINLGDPLSGVAVTGFPPLDGWNPGYNLVMTLHLLAFDY